MYQSVYFIITISYTR